jgi:uncharacterized lipoprotein YddW (UPF0748 family)
MYLFQRLSSAHSCLHLPHLFRLLLAGCLSTAISACSVHPIKPVAPASPTTTPAATKIQARREPATATQAPAAPREFRAAWVSTVSNIDWPSRKNLSTDKQKKEIIAILDMAVELRLNAIVLQVRPSADAIYPSTLEPWSEFLSGEQGKAPSPFYDPLQMWIEQAHARRLELHAWFNPYRAKTGNGKSALTQANFNKIAPTALKRYGDLWWLDPGEPVAMQHTLAVISDVVRRYDVDGIHLDDYFYPYPVKNSKGGELMFPDDPSWGNYQRQGGQLTRADWRRQNVNRLVEAAYLRVHEERSWVKFGISPFGIGRPDRLPMGIRGFSQYDQLYADVELWLERGWVDYLAPQLYWPMEQRAQDFRVLRDYWQEQNSRNRHIWPGLFTNNLEHRNSSWPAEEILQQISATRELAVNNKSIGHLHFSISALMQNRKNIRSRLTSEKYQDDALVPASPWLGKNSQPAPALEINSEQNMIQVTLATSSEVRQLAIWKRYKNRWVFSVQPVSRLTIDLSEDKQYGIVTEVVVSSIDRTGQESPRSSYRRQ